MHPQVEKKKYKHNHTTLAPAMKQLTNIEYWDFCCLIFPESLTMNILLILEIAF